MADRANAAARPTYLVEHYRTGAGVEELSRSATRVRDAVAQLERESRQIVYLDATIVPADNYFASVLEATSERVAREALEHAGIPFDRISPAIRLTRSGTDTESTNVRGSDRSDQLTITHEPGKEPNSHED